MAAFSPRRVHGPAEQRLMKQGGLALTAIATVAFVWPRLLAWPVGVVCVWLAVALFLRSRR